MNELEKFLRAHRAKFGTLQDLANDMKITFSGLLRAQKAGKLSVENCLNLAEALGVEPPLVFRAAQKPKQADQFERLYGKTTNPMPTEDWRHLEAWRALTADAQAMVRAQMQYLPKRAAQSSEEKASTKRPTMAKKRRAVGEGPSETAPKKGH